MIDIDHRSGSIYGGRWEFSSQSHPSIVGGAVTLEGSIDAANHAARHCVERGTGGIAVDPESLQRHVAHHVRSAA